VRAVVSAIHQARLGVRSSSVTVDPRQLKAVALSVETAIPAARLLDLDVCAADGDGQTGGERIPAHRPGLTHKIDL